MPVFLLFLDCVWQLQQQHGPAFEFTETYLTVLSDSLYLPIFSTFFFNSQQQRDTHLVSHPHPNLGDLGYRHNQRPRLDSKARLGSIVNP